MPPTEVASPRVRQSTKNILNSRYKKMKQIILGFVMVAALIFIIGSCGAWDEGRIGLGQCLIQSAIGIVAEYLALKNFES